MFVFDDRGKQEYPNKNLSEQGREPTTNSTHMSTPGFEPGPHWWEASALTTRHEPHLHSRIQVPLTKTGNQSLKIKYCLGSLT